MSSPNRPSKLFTRHARNRAETRYGVGVNKDLARQLIGQIQNGKARFVDRSSLSRTRWDVDVNGQTFRVVYSNRHKKLITFLTVNERADE